MSVSAVVLQHGLFEMTQVAVDSLRANDYAPAEIIVVDNGSPDLVGRSGAGYGFTHLIQLPENLGYVLGTNAGWSEVKSDYALLCNNDVSLARQCIGRLVAAMEADPALGWVSACYQNGGWPASHTDFPPAVVTVLDNSRGADRRALDEWSETLAEITPEYCHVTECTVVLVRRAAWGSVGLFDPELVFHHSHDYGLRLSEKGWKLANLHAAVYWHNMNHPTLALPGAWGTTEQREQSDRHMQDKWGDTWKSLVK